MDEASRELLTADEDVASVIGHPQYGLIKLVGRIGVARCRRAAWRREPEALRMRRLWVAESLRPSAVTDRWTETRASITDAAFDNVALLVAPNEHLEAAAIAAALREAIRRTGRDRRLGHRGSRARPPRRRRTGPLWHRRRPIPAARRPARRTAGPVAHAGAGGRLQPGDPAALLALAKHRWSGSLLRRGPCRPSSRCSKWRSCAAAPAASARRRLVELVRQARKADA
jgi:ATP-dependent helicase/nuclease subunit B